MSNVQEIAKSLQPHAGNFYSQSGEDGILQAIFSKIRPDNKWCMECGAGDGLLFSNSRLLLETGWTGVLIEAHPDKFERLTKNSAEFGERAKCFNVTVDRTHRLDDILESAGAPTNIDLAVIDVDGQDFYLFNSLFRYSPRVVMIEFSRFEDPNFIPTLDGEGQAGLNAIHDLAAGKFYSPVWRSVTNVIFVRSPLENLFDG